MIRPVLLIALPLFFAFLLPVIGLWNKKGVKYVTVGVMGVELLLAVALLDEVLLHPVIDKIGGFVPPIGIVLMVGRLGGFLTLIIALSAFVISIYNLWEDKEPIVRYNMLSLLLLMGSVGMVITGDIFNLFVFLEITSIASYGLASYNRDARGFSGAIKYVVLGSIGSSFVLIGIALIYAQLRTLNMLDIAHRIGEMDPYVRLIAFTSLFLGFGVEAEMFPLNTWVPGVYDGAPNAVVSMFASMPAKSSIFALARMMFTVFSFSGFMWFVAILGLITVFFGEMVAFAQDKLKKMLAYSSIGQMGMIIMGLGIGTAMSVEGAFFQMFGHALAKALLFLAAGYMIYAVKSEKIQDMVGVAKNPLVGVPVVIAILSLLGMPPFVGFYGKFYIVLGGIDARAYGIIALFLAATIIEVVYYARFIKVAFAKPVREYVSPEPVVYLPMMVFAIVIVVFGIFPAPIFAILSKVSMFILGGI